MSKLNKYLEAAKSNDNFKKFRQILKETEKEYNKDKSKKDEYYIAKDLLDDMEYEHDHGYPFKTMMDIIEDMMIQSDGYAREEAPKFWKLLENKIKNN